MRNILNILYIFIAVYITSLLLVSCYYDGINTIIYPAPPKIETNDSCKAPYSSYTMVKSVIELNDALQNNLNHCLADNIVIDINTWKQIPKFSGHLYGDGKTLTINIGTTTNYLPLINVIGSSGNIEGLSIAVNALIQSNSNTALLGFKNDGKLKDIRLIGNGELNGYEDVGGLVAINANHIENITSNIRVIGKGGASDNYVGGLVGINENNGVIENCSISNTAIVNRGKGNLGAIAGENKGSIIKCKVINTEIEFGYETANAGGIAGANQGSIILSASKTNIKPIQQSILTKNVNIGGLVGINKNKIEKSYANKPIIELSDVDSAAQIYAGGLVGYNKEGNILNSYASHTSFNANISNSLLAGGLVGYFYKGTITESYAAFTNASNSNNIGNVIGKVNTQDTSMTNVFSHLVSNPQLQIIGVGTNTNIISQDLTSTANLPNDFKSSIWEYAKATNYNLPTLINNPHQ